MPSGLLPFLHIMLPHSPFNLKSNALDLKSMCSACHDARPQKAAAHSSFNSAQNIQSYHTAVVRQTHVGKRQRFGMLDIKLHAGQVSQCAPSMNCDVAQRSSVLVFWSFIAKSACQMLMDCLQLFNKLDASLEFSSGCPC